MLRIGSTASASMLIAESIAPESNRRHCEHCAQPNRLQKKTIVKKLGRENVESNSCQNRHFDHKNVGAKLFENKTLKRKAW